MLTTLVCDGYTPYTHYTTTMVMTHDNNFVSDVEHESAPAEVEDSNTARAPKCGNYAGFPTYTLLLYYEGIRGTLTQ